MSRTIVGRGWACASCTDSSDECAHRTFLEVIARGRPRWVVCCSYETEYEAESEFGSSHNSTAPNVVLVLDAEGEVLDQVVYVSGRQLGPLPLLCSCCSCC